MKRTCSIATAAIVGLALMSTAKAGVGYNGDFTGYGNDTQGPEIYIVYNGTTTTVATAFSLGYATLDQGPYDGSDDTYIGVLNTSAAGVLNSVNLSSALDIFGFDGDGITTYGAPGNAADTTGYAGPGVTYSGINGAKTAGTVNFAGGLQPGGTAYFSLEEAISGAVGNGTVTVTNGAPDAASTMALLGGSLLGLGALRRKLKL